MTQTRLLLWPLTIFPQWHICCVKVWFLDRRNRKRSVLVVDLRARGTKCSSNLKSEKGRLCKYFLGCLHLKETFFKKTVLCSQSFYTFLHDAPQPFLVQKLFFLNYPKTPECSQNSPEQSKINTVPFPYTFLWTHRTMDIHLRRRPFLALNSRPFSTLWSNRILFWKEDACTFTAMSHNTNYCGHFLDFDSKCVVIFRGDFREEILKNSALLWGNLVCFFYEKPTLTKWCFVFKINFLCSLANPN